jgi:hypothetical protein
MLGEVAEWSKAATRKGCYTVKTCIGGSNPSPLRQTKWLGMGSDCGVALSQIDSSSGFCASRFEARSDRK